MSVVTKKNFLIVTAFFATTAVVVVCLMAGVVVRRQWVYVPSDYAKENLMSELSAEPEFTKPLEFPEDARRTGRILTVPIFMYHHVGLLPAKAGAARQDLTVSTADFEQEVKFLSEQGYSTVTLRDIYLYGLGQKVLPTKPVVFTFDDGYADVFENAVPILQQYGFVGTFAIITQYPGAKHVTNLYASWQQIAQALAQGMEIVSHTQNHFDGTNKKFDYQYILTNLRNSMADLQTHLGSATNILVYPYGHYNQQYLEAAHTAGFVMGITTHEGATVYLDHLMEIPRLRVHGHENLALFKKIFLENISPQTTKPKE